jgi:hypothetical protein
LEFFCLFILKNLANLTEKRYTINHYPGYLSALPPESGKDIYSKKIENLDKKHSKTG